MTGSTFHIPNTSPRREPRHPRLIKAVKAAWLAAGDVRAVHGVVVFYFEGGATMHLDEAAYAAMVVEKLIDWGDFCEEHAIELVLAQRKFFAAAHRSAVPYAAAVEFALDRV